MGPEAVLASEPVLREFQMLPGPVASETGPEIEKS